MGHSKKCYWSPTAGAYTIYYYIILEGESVFFSFRGVPLVVSFKLFQRNTPLSERLGFRAKALKPTTFLRANILRSEPR